MPRTTGAGETDDPQAVELRPSQSLDWDPDWQRTGPQAGGAPSEGARVGRYRIRMKKMTPTAGPDVYVAALDGWRRECVVALRLAVRAASALEEVVKMATLELRQGTAVTPATVRRLVRSAVALNKKLGDPTNVTR